MVEKDLRYFGIYNNYFEGVMDLLDTCIAMTFSYEKGTVFLKCVENK